MPFIAPISERTQRVLSKTELPVNRLTGAAVRIGAGAAALAQLIIQARRPSFGNIELSCTLIEDHGFSNTIPGVPVQSGNTENDAIIHDPPKLLITGIISDMASTFQDQIHLYRNISARRKYSGRSNRDTAWARIQTLNVSKEPFEVFTHFALYPDMVFKSVRVVEDGASDMVLRMEFVKFRQVNVRIRKYLSDLTADIAADQDNLGTSQVHDVSNLDIEASIADVTTGPLSDLHIGITDITTTF